MEKEHLVAKKDNSKRTIGILVLIIVVLIIALSVVSFLYFTSRDGKKEYIENPADDNDVTETNKPSEDIPVTEKSLKEEELKKYLSYVPMLLEYDSEHDSAFSVNYGYKVDAYTGKKVTVNDLDKKLLLAIAFNNTQVEKDVSKVDKYAWCGNNNTCTGDMYVLVSKLNSTLKKFYNIDSLEID